MVEEECWTAVVVVDNIAVVVDNYWHLYPNIGYTSYSKRCYRCVYWVVFVVAVLPWMTMVVVVVHTCHLKKWRRLLDVILAAVGIQMYVVVVAADFLVENYCSEPQQHWEAPRVPPCAATAVRSTCAVHMEVERVALA